MGRRPRDGEFEVTYHINDGYAGGERPQSFIMSIGDVDEGMNDEQLQTLASDAAHEDMQQRVSAAVTNGDEFVAWVRTQFSRRE